MSKEAADAYLLSLLEDVNAYGSDALTALEEGRPDDVRTNLQGLLDLVREAIGDIEQAELESKSGE